MQPSPTTVRISVTGVAPRVGGSASFSATATFSDQATRDVTADALWSSSAPSFATVTAGVVKGLAPGSAIISATFQNVTGSASIAVTSSPDSGVTSFMRDYIEALFLGTGPLTPTDGVGGCPRSGSWTGFPPGTSIELLISSTIPQAGVNALITSSAGVPTAAVGALSVTASMTPDVDPIPLANQVTATMHADPISLGCSFPQGCTILSFVPGSAFIQSARSILVTNQTPAAYVHDAIGHGVLGLCHVDGNLIGGARLSLMSYGPGVFSSQLPTQLSEFDLAATQAVFASGLARGARRADFVQAGLVNPSNGAVMNVMEPSSATTTQVAASRIR